MPFTTTTKHDFFFCKWLHGSIVHSWIEIGFFSSFVFIVSSYSSPSLSQPPISLSNCPVCCHWNPKSYPNVFSAEDAIRIRFILCSDRIVRGEKSEDYQEKHCWKVCSECEWDWVFLTLNQCVAMLMISRWDRRGQAWIHLFPISLLASDFPVMRSVEIKKKLFFVLFCSLTNITIVYCTISFNSIFI